jgi:hypothetical protein
MFPFSALVLGADSQSVFMEHPYAIFSSFR